jgi:hypothetical protein
VSPLPFADPLSIGEAPHHFESHPRKREREQSAVGAQSPYCAISPRRNKGIAPPLRHLRAKPLPRHNKGIAPYLPLAIGKSDESKREME